MVYRIRSKLCGCNVVRFLQILGACLKYAELKCAIFLHKYYINTLA